MTPHLPLEDLGTTKRERALLGRVGVVLVAVASGAGLGVGGYAWASSRIAAVGTQIARVEAKVDGHLYEMERLRPVMDRSVERIDGKLELLIEDCYRRGGCRK